MSAKISQALIRRLEQIRDGGDDFDARNASSALLLLKKLKRQDDYEANKTRPDKDGWYQALWVMPEKHRKLEVIRDGVVLSEEFDGEWWHGSHNVMGTVLKPEKWRYADRRYSARK